MYFWTSRNIIDILLKKSRPSGRKLILIVFKGSPPVLIFDGNLRFFAYFFILLVLLIIFGPYIMVLK